jgi:hypothetical protein
MEKERTYTYATRESPNHSYTLPIKEPRVIGTPKEINCFSTSEEAEISAKQTGLEFVLINLANARCTIIP